MKALARWLGDWASGDSEPAKGEVTRRRFIRGSVLGAAAFATISASAIGRTQEDAEEEEVLCSGIEEPECITCRGGLTYKCYDCIRNYLGEICSARTCTYWCPPGPGANCTCGWG